MPQIKAAIIYNKVVQDNYFRLIIEAPEIAIKASPGQFVNIKLSQDYEPLLRRPFSIHRAEGKGIEILYEVVGRGSEILSQEKPGSHLDILGPLGSGFSYNLSLTAYRLPILVAGGMGIAPLLFLAEGIRTDYPQFNITVLIGAKTKKDILCEKEFKELGCHVKIATDDGARGSRGKVTDLLKRILRVNELTSQRATIYACGPRPMLKEVSRLSQVYKIPAQVSLEEHLACGIGACLGCAVKTREGFKRVCKEGPVFNAGEIVW